MTKNKTVFLLYVFTLLFLSLTDVIGQDYAVGSPEIEIKNSDQIALGSSYQIGKKVFFKVLRVFKGDLIVSQEYQVKIAGAEMDPRYSEAVERSVLSTGRGQSFILLGQTSKDERGNIFVAPRVPNFSQWPQGMAKFSDFPYKTLDECIEFVEKQLQSKKQQTETKSNFTEEVVRLNEPKVQSKAQTVTLPVSKKHSQGSSATKRSMAGFMFVELPWILVAFLSVLCFWLYRRDRNHKS